MSNKAFVSKNGDTNFYYSHLAINKSRLKEFNPKNTFFSNERNFYLSGDTEFQVELFNPTDKTMGAKISINGKPMSSSYLVLYPGQRIWLERDFDTKNKFKFTVYEIDKNDPIAVAATRNNGEVKIEFYTEKEKEVATYVTASTRTIDPWIYKDATPWKPLDIRWDVSTGCSNISSVYCDNAEIASINAVLNSSISAPEGSMYSYTSCDGAECSYTSYSTSDIEPETKETGIINRSSSKSSQEFENIDGIDFELLPSRIEIMHMLPLSEKRLTAEDMNMRKYCPNCGKKLKANYNFCPVCGTKVE